MLRLEAKKGIKKEEDLDRPRGLLTTFLIGVLIRYFGVRDLKDLRYLDNLEVPL